MHSEPSESLCGLCCCSWGILWVNNEAFQNIFVDLFTFWMKRSDSYVLLLSSWMLQTLRSVCSLSWSHVHCLCNNVKGKISPKNTILSSFIHLHVFKNLYRPLYAVEHKTIYFENRLCGFVSIQWKSVRTNLGNSSKYLLLCYGRK